VVDLENADATKMAATLRGWCCSGEVQQPGSTPTAVGGGASAALSASSGAATRGQHGGQIQADVGRPTRSSSLRPTPQYRQLRAVIDACSMRAGRRCLWKA